jgi:hypothetical protein
LANRLREEADMENDSMRDSERQWRERFPKLDEALGAAIAAPRLDGEFDRAVWARIEVERRAALELPQRAVRRVRVAQWLAIGNWLAAGLSAVAVALALARAFMTPEFESGRLGANAPVIALAIGATALLGGLAALAPVRYWLRDLA